MVAASVSPPLLVPRFLSQVTAALFEDLPAPLAQADIALAIASLRQGQQRLAHQVPVGTEIVVDTHRVRLAAGCPASAAPSDIEFKWTPATAARYLGLRAMALHCAGAPSVTNPTSSTVQPIEEAVATVMAQVIRCGGERTPGPWLAQFGPAAQAVVFAHAQRWAEQATTWLPLRLIDPRALRFLNDDWWPGRGCADRTLVIHGRRDVTFETGNRRVAMTLAGGAVGSPGAAESDALSALAAILSDPRGRLARVVRVHPASGEVVVTDVTSAVLQLGVTVVLATAAAVVDQGGAATTPGPGCTWCDRQSNCPPGQAWLTRPDRRAMGLPLHTALV